MHALSITQAQLHSLRDRLVGWKAQRVTSPELLARAMQAMKLPGTAVDAGIALVRALAAATPHGVIEPAWSIAEALVEVIGARRLAGERLVVPDDIEMMICQSDAELHVLREAARRGAPIEQRDRLYSPLQPGQTNPWVLRNNDSPLGDGHTKQYRLAAR